MVLTLKESLLLSAAVGFFIIWAGELFQGVPLKASYFWIMFSIACLLYFQYTKNVRLKKEATAAKPQPAVKKPLSKKKK